MRWLYSAVGVSLLVATLSLGWVAWIAADPEHWFPGAYAEEGPRGDQGPDGPRGPRGRQGRPGNPGDDTVAARLDDLEILVDDLDSAVADSSQSDELRGRIDDLELFLDDLSSRIDTVEFDMGDVEDQVQTACDELYNLSDVSYGC